MVQASEFIKRLQEERTDYKYVSQVKMQTNSLKQLATGIYTEPERFVYELLQNAVDAFADVDAETLQILIKAEEGKFIFMHNGKAFSPKDVEGICDVGNGSKSEDSKKIGYKGIGFKSVFMPTVRRVSIKSGEFCFMFDREKAAALMPDFPQGRLAPNDVPWQVIPIEQPELSDFDLSVFNVATIVETPDASMLADKVQRLFSNLQILLFLSSKNIDIRFERNGRQVFSVGKRMERNGLDSNTWTVTLLHDTSVESTWLLHEDAINVTPEVKEDLANDFNTPDKLKKAERLEISFAVQLDGNSLMKVENSTVFTFLPTSYSNLNEPFLVNANFITDASRQQLHQGSKWNQLIFKNIPELYLNFVAKFSSTYANYADVLPQRYPAHDTLTDFYRDALEDSFHNVAFIPNADGSSLLKVREVLIDKAGICDSVIPSQSVFDYIAEKKDRHFSMRNLVSDTSICKYVQNDYVVRIEDEDILGILKSIPTLTDFSNENDIELIKFLQAHAAGMDDPKASSTFEEGLRHTSFLRNEADGWECPANLNMPSKTKEYNAQVKPDNILNAAVYDGLKYAPNVLKWLTGSMGIRELSRSNFARYILEHSDYITEENAMEVGRLLYLSWKDDHILDDEDCCKLIASYPFLSKNGELKPLGTLYLGSKYKPDDDIEPICHDKSMFISDEYASDKDADDWAYFLKQCGVNYQIGLTEKVVRASDLGYDFLNEISTTFSKIDHPMKGYWGYPNPIINIQFRLYYFSLIDPECPDYDLDRFVLTRVLSKKQDMGSCVDKVFGKVSYWGNRIEKRMIDHAPYTFSSRYKSYMEYALANVQRFPTSLGTSELAEDVFINSASNLEIGARYMPVLNIDNDIDGSWRALLPFKREFSLQDLLTILEKVSEDTQASKEEAKSCVSRVYREILDRNLQDRAELADWASGHKILSQSGDFMSPKDLNYITIDGFKSGKKVFCENLGRDNRDKLLSLLKSFGVRVITPNEIRPAFEGDRECSDIKDRLTAKVQYIALLKMDSDSDLDRSMKVLGEKISRSKFVKCDQISLTYGDDEDVLQKQTFAQDGTFYYTGDVTPAKIEPLLAPLCKFLGIRSCEGELMVILLTDSPQDLADFLSDKGYDISCLPSLAHQGKSNWRGTAQHSGPAFHGHDGAESSENPHGDGSKASSEEYRKEYIDKYAKDVERFIGSDYSLPEDSKKAMHVISRYRSLMYLKGLGPEYTFEEGFDENEFIREGSYRQIPLANGKKMNIQGASYGIWHLAQRMERHC